MTEAIEAIHKHLDACRQCREHPFALCPVGELLLLAAAKQDALAEREMEERPAAQLVGN